MERHFPFLVGMTVVEYMIILAIIGLIVAMAIPAIMGSGRPADAELYAAWCKLENRHDISLEEWRDLRRSGLLTNHTK